MRPDDDDRGDWVAVLRADSTWADVEAAIERETARAIADLHLRVRDLVDLSPADRLAMAARLEAFVSQQTRATIEAAWADLRGERIH